MPVLINTIWHRIRKHEGSIFRTITGIPFSYEIQSDHVVTDRTPYWLSKSQFAIALEMVPFDGPGVINNLVRGPSYIWAILHDSRIRLNDY